MIHFDIEKLLKESLDQHLNQPKSQTPFHLDEAIRYSLLSPGKRIRPRLFLACAEMLELQIENIIPSSLALEMLHCFTLIHDDLPCMDNDDFRRGKPSNHKKFGESIALLAGDALMALGIEVFLDSKVVAPRLLSGLKRFLWAAGPRGVIGGQASESLLGAHSSWNDLKKLHSQKTGALFSAALLIPKDFAGISDDSEQGRAIDSFAHELGLAFQIADDLEDTLQDSASHSLHKPTSVLFYLSPLEASQKTLKSLKYTTDALIKIWAEKSDPLKQITQEVIQKIEKATGALT